MNKFLKLTILTLFLNPIHTFADQSDFLNLCKTFMNKKSEGQKTCTQLNQTFFNNSSKEPVVPFSPKTVKAQSSNIDKKIQFIVFNDPNYLPGAVYCYGVFMGWISMNKVTPDHLGLNTSGFSVLNERLDEYEKWLSGPQGKTCKNYVEKNSEVPLTNLKNSLEKHTALIALNPLAAVRSNNGNLRAVMKELRTTVNHERVHVYQVLCPNFEKASIDAWKSLSTAQKNNYKLRFPSYNWNDTRVAGRESMSFKLENSPQDIEKFIRDCKNLN